MEQMAARKVHILEVGGSSPSSATMENKKEIDQFFADTIIDRPYCFSVNSTYFYLYPVTLGKMILLQRQIENLDVNIENMKLGVPLEALRLAQEKRDICLTFVTYHTCKTKEEVFDVQFVESRKAFFDKELSEDDLASLMIILLTSDKTNVFIKHFGIDKENDRLNTVMRIKKKNDKNNLVFGGKTQYGTLIDSACERYGWTKEYVVWGIDYTSLRLMLADKVNSVYCTDDELNKLPASVKNADEEIIKPTKENMELIMSMDWR